MAGSTIGSTKITVEPILTNGNSYKYKTAANPTVPVYFDSCRSGYTNWDGTSDITATDGRKIVMVEVDTESRCLGVGTADVVVKA